MSPERVYGGRYAVIELVGTGGMAEVYRARDELLGREVAIKVLSERFSRDPTFVERFRREAQSAANLSHPNIVSLYDYGSDGETYFIVMEYIEGRTLADVIHDNGPLMPERAAEIAADVAAALQRAHTGGLVHRDIKPGNIMITDSGQTKVTDFGIARAVGGDRDATMTQAGMVIGTAAYLSPEQAQGERVDARSDVYALGVVLYEMLTSVTPFTGDTPLSIAYKHVREEAVAPSKANPHVPSDLDAVVLKAMTKDPGGRYSSADEMRADLERFLSGQKVQAAPVATAAQTSVIAGTGTQMMGQTDMLYDESESSRAGWYIGITLAVLLIAGIAAFFLADSLFGAPKVTVPQLIGLDKDEARNQLQELNLKSEIVEKQSRNAPPGEVIGQDPGEGETLQEGDTVTLTVSAGAKQVLVPDLTGLTEEEAAQLLEDEHLVLGEVTEVPDEAEVGDIFDQNPPSGESVDRGTEVDVQVSSGEKVIVPDVTNQTEEQARANLEALGFVVTSNSVPDETAAGTVIDQTPDGGTEAEKGSTVEILVSEGDSRPMPDVTGMDGDEAQAMLENEYSLSVTQVDETEPCVEPPGNVCRQDPEPGTEVSPGDSVTLYVMGGDASLDLDSLLFGLISFFS